MNVPAGTTLAVEIEQPVSLRGRGRVCAAATRTRSTRRRSASATRRRRSRSGSTIAVRSTASSTTRRVARCSSSRSTRGFSGDGQSRRTHGARAGREPGRRCRVGAAPRSPADDASTRASRRAERSSSRLRGASSAARASGRLNPSRTYSQGDLERWFALSAFADNASLYEQIVRGGDNADADGARRPRAGRRGAACRYGAAVGARVVAAPERVDHAAPASSRRSTRSARSYRGRSVTIRRVAAVARTGTVVACGPVVRSHAFGRDTSVSRARLSSATAPRCARFPHAREQSVNETVPRPSPAGRATTSSSARPPRR